MIISVDISALETFDITADGTPDVIVGRSDGTVQVYSVDGGGEPTQRFKHVIFYYVYSFSRLCARDSVTYYVRNINLTMLVRWERIIRTKK